MNEFLADLNEPQYEAVTHTEGPLMIVAGAGSGKTKVLTSRIAYLLSNGVSPFQILALTFTNKAAKEMKDRIFSLLNNTQPYNLYIGTFHSVFARVLRNEAEKLGYSTNFTIYDTEESKSLIHNIVKAFDLDKKIYKAGALLNRISDLKNNLILAKDYIENPKLQQKDYYSKMTATAKIYLKYTEECFRNGAMDFDDLLLKTFELFTLFPDMLLKYQQKFKYILIDEYQDTNHLQYRIIKLIAALHQNICVVGDDAQSIYSFRGATIENILKFNHDYPQVKKIVLSQNYRSQEYILNAANQVIKNNTSQIEKKLWTQIKAGEKITYFEAYSDIDESKKVADIIKEEVLRNHILYSQIAILYRTNSQSRSFEETFRRNNIPYIIYGGLSFYQRKEIKDVLAYFRIICNPADNEQLKRIINIPARGIGKTTIEKCLIVADEKKTPLLEILKNPDIVGLKSSTALTVKNFSTMISYLQGLVKLYDAYYVAEQICKHSLILKELMEDKTVEGVARLENVQELLNSIKEWTQLPDNSMGEVVDKSLGSYLQQISLLTDDDKDKNQNQDLVKLMTIHAAKGLEFNDVFVVGIEEGLFPNISRLKTKEELEEERRLFYVAITRAKEKLFLSSCQSRYQYGINNFTTPSRFLSEISDNIINKLNLVYNAGLHSFKKPFEYNNPFNSRGGDTEILEESFSKNFNNKPKQLVNVYSTNNLTDNHVGLNNLKEGQLVMHPKFGRGLIKKLEGDINNLIAHIIFDKYQDEIKRIMIKYCQMSIIE